MALKSKKVKTFLLILISLILLAIGMGISLYIGTKSIDFNTIIRSIFVNDNTLTVYIKRLREKIEEDPTHPEMILTVRGIGYRLGGSNV